MNYRDTLNLPQSKIPMRANLAQREPEFQRFWQEREIYRKSLEKDAPRGVFVLHDGPPYSNGDLHLGHALNKILKDIILRFRTMQGYRSPYVPGWDNHGMPIEFAVAAEFRERGEEPSVVDLRRACRRYARKWVKIQSKQFQRLGIRGDWDHPYLTMDQEYEARIVKNFAALAEKGYIYRGLRPILWCPHDETALSEAELEYEDHVSESIYVRFPLAEDPDGVFPAGASAYTIIWTTTPWTIPANLAVAFHPEVEYALIKAGEEHYLLAEGLREATASACGLEGHELVKRLPGKELANLVFRHPLHASEAAFARDSKGVLADYVTLEQGTGVVHTAPGHGPDDFATGRKYDLEIFCPVDGKGRFTDQAGSFAGLPVDPEGNEAVLKALAECGNLLHHEKFAHQYPHCWRCHNPLLFRTTEQWFLSIDHPLNGQTHREAALAAIQQTRWYPPESRLRIEAMVEGRPDWCLSRQRAWGVGLPIFYCDACDEPILTPESLAAAHEMVLARGSDSWYQLPAEEILPEGFQCPRCQSSGPFRKETDVLDVWFDSGSSWAAVLEPDEELAYPADIYLEGSDQHRGWFNASLMVSVGLRGIAPFKGVVSHGFALGADGRKMSKSRGNVIDPLEEMKTGGADLLRLWVASTDYGDDVRVGREILDRVADAYRRLRNTLRFLLGNLYDFDPNSDAVPLSELSEIDRWALHRAGELFGNSLRAYDVYEFHPIFHAVHNFCAVDLSAVYLNVTKDRLYTCRADSRERRSAQTAMYLIADGLVRLLAPILAHTAEEVWRQLPGEREESVHLATVPTGFEAWRDDELSERWSHLLEARDIANRELEAAKRDGRIDQPLAAAVTLRANADWLAQLQPYADDLATLFVVSEVRLVEGGEGLEVEVAPAEGEKCQRCWLVRPEVGQDAEHPGLCGRCRETIA